MSKAASIKAKLKNRAMKENRTFQEILAIYGLERALYRVSVSPHSSNYILKGGMLLYALFESNFIRGTADVDFLGRPINNDIETIKQSFEDIFNIQYIEDGIVFDTASLSITRITEFKKYPGISITIDSYLEKTKIRVQIDVGFGDVIYPNTVKMAYPTLLDQPAPLINVYSKESIIAEKFEAIVSLGNANSRMKDFYDIYVLLNTYDFEGSILTEALKETFSNRKTKFSSVSAFEAGFVKDSNRLRMWTSFQKSKNVKQVVDFEEVIHQIKGFLLPIIDSLNQSTNEAMIWNHKTSAWKVN